MQIFQCLNARNMRWFTVKYIDWDVISNTALLTVKISEWMTCCKQISSQLLPMTEEDDFYGAVRSCVFPAPNETGKFVGHNCFFSRSKSKYPTMPLQQWWLLWEGCRYWICMFRVRTLQKWSFWIEGPAWARISSWTKFSLGSKTFATWHAGLTSSLRCCSCLKIHNFKAVQA